MAFTSTGDVILGIACVVIGLTVAAAAAQAARRTRNWLFFICAVGGLAFAVGVAAQRPFPSEDALQLDRANAANSTPGPWDAGVHIPVLNLHATPVAVGGVLVAVVGLSLVLFFEAVPDQPVAPPEPLPELEEGDTV
jgi:hypothetical protein